MHNRWRLAVSTISRRTSIFSNVHARTSGTSTVLYTGYISVQFLFLVTFTRERLEPVQSYTCSVYFSSVSIFSNVHARTPGTSTVLYLQCFLNQLWSSTIFYHQHRVTTSSGVLCIHADSLNFLLYFRLRLGRPSCVSIVFIDPSTPDET